MSPSRRWQVVLPVKGGPTAKSRLGVAGQDRHGLALAMALDCLDAVLTTPGVCRAVVATDDEVSAAAARDLGADVLVPGQHTTGLTTTGLSTTGLSTTGLNAAVTLAVDRCPPGTGLLALLADVPCLRPEDLRAGLDAVEAALDDGAGWVLVPDAEGTGTVLLAADPAGLMVPAFGPGSASAHARLGARRLDLDVVRLRRDVDTDEALAAATALGVGPRTRRSLGGVQATVLTYDATAREGTVVTDDGLRLTMPTTSLERSGLRHLRPGQRVTCVRDGDSVADVHVVGITG